MPDARVRPLKDVMEDQAPYFFPNPHAATWGRQYFDGWYCLHRAKPAWARDCTEGQSGAWGMAKSMGLKVEPAALM